MDGLGVAGAMDGEKRPKTILFCRFSGEIHLNIFDEFRQLLFFHHIIFRLVTNYWPPRLVTTFINFTRVIKFCQPLLSCYFSQKICIVHCLFYLFWFESIYPIWTLKESAEKAIFNSSQHSLTFSEYRTIHPRHSEPIQAATGHHGNRNIKAIPCRVEVYCFLIKRL